MKKLAALFLVSFVSLGFATQVSAAKVNLNSPEWLGAFNLEKTELDSIKTAFEKALNAPIDAAQQCGEYVQDCEVRAAREWNVDGETYREMVIYLHPNRHASRAVGQEKGKWPAVASN